MDAVRTDGAERRNGAMKKISIKTADGNRYDFEQECSVMDGNVINGLLEWIGVTQDATTIRWFYVPNIVSITEREIDNA